MFTASVRIHHRWTSSYCEIVLRAWEIPESKLECKIRGIVAVKTLLGVEYNTNHLKALCGSGLAVARRKLGISVGLVVEVDSVKGIICDGDEQGVCLACAFAIAESLQKSSAEIATIVGEWEIYE